MSCSHWLHVSKGQTILLQWCNLTSSGDGSTLSWDSSTIRTKSNTIKTMWYKIAFHPKLTTDTCAQYERYKSVSRYIMGPLSGRWRLCGNDQQCLAAPIWKYRSGFGDHRFTFFIDLLPNNIFYTNLTNIVHWVVVYKDVAYLITLNLGEVEKK